MKQNSILVSSRARACEVVFPRGEHKNSVCREDDDTTTDTTDSYAACVSKVKVLKVLSN